MLELSGELEPTRLTELIAAVVQATNDKTANAAHASNPSRASHRLTEKA